MKKKSFILFDASFAPVLFSWFPDIPSKCKFCGKKITPKNVGVIGNDFVVCKNICCLIDWNEERKNGKVKLGRRN